MKLWSVGSQGKIYKSVKDARWRDSIQKNLCHLLWLLENFGMVLCTFIAKGTRDHVLLQFFGYTVLFQSFINVISNNLGGTKGQPVHRQRACAAMVIGWHQHTGWTVWGQV